MMIATATLYILVLISMTLTLIGHSCMRKQIHLLSADVSVTVNKTWYAATGSQSLKTHAEVIS